MEAAGRTVLVTGGGRRLGREIALALGRAGARVAVHYNASGDGAQDTVREIESLGTEAEAFQADLTLAGAPAALVSAVRSSFGGLDVLINSAAVMERTPIDEVTPGEWDAMVALNLRAPFFCAIEAARAMRRGRQLVDAGDDQPGERGVIINIADLAGLESWSGYIPHGITKAGVVYMTRALARVLAPGIRVNAIAPGTVLLPDDFDPAVTERLERTTPLRRHGTPADVTDAVLYLLSAAYVTGETLVVDGGRHVR